MKSFVLFLTMAVMGSISHAKSNDLNCSARVCSSGPYGGSCSNVSVRADLEKEILYFSNVTKSNSGLRLQYEIVDVEKDYQEGTFRIRGQKGSDKATFTLSVYGPKGVRGEFSSKKQRKFSYRCSAIINL